jgi:long-chain acyl-CoA synthetase
LGYPQVFSMYGLTECKRVSYLPPQDLHRKPGSVGIPIPNTEVYVMDANGLEVPPGTVGQLVVRGSHVMAGYWNAPELTRERLKPGHLPGERWLYTGDLFYRDDEGYLYFVGRVDEMIKSRGEKVSPREIEDLLHGFSGVGEAAVFGVPHHLLGEEVVACISPTLGHDLKIQDIRHYLSQKLENYKMPSRIFMRSSMPRTSNGKIDKQFLKTSIQELL